MRWLSDGTTFDRAQAWNGMARAIGHWHLRGYGQWVLQRRDTGEAIGRSGLYHPEGWPGLEVGYVIAPEHQGHGFATEAARASLRYAREVVGADRVISLVHPDNARSRRVAEKVGGVVEGMVHVASIDALVYRYR